MLRNKKHIYGPRDATVPVRINFGEFMLTNFWNYKGNNALINGATQEITKYGQLAQEATNLAVSLTRIGVGKGDIVAIMSDNRPEYFSIFVGVACAGAVITTINYLYTEGETKHILSISKPSYLFCTSTIYKNQGRIIKPFKFKKIIIIDDEEIGDLLNYSDLAKVNESTNKDGSTINKDSIVAVTEKVKLTRNVAFEEIDPVSIKGQTDTLVILYSSGTTGLPKGVMLTHLNLITMTSIRPLEFHDGVIMLIGPWFHAMGLVGLFSGFSRGKTFAFLSKFDLDSMLKTIERHRVETLVAVPAVLVAVTKSSAKFDFSSVRYVVAGAAPIHKDTERDFMRKFPNVLGIIKGYGMTECCLAIAKNSFSINLPGTVGRVMDNAVVKIIDMETLETLGANQTGELYVKGDILMKGYVGKDLRKDLDHEGFFKTGDVGYYDEQGYLFIVDRVKELIKYKGNQVAPAELEAILLQHDSVREAGVVGRADEDAGELPMAFVSLQPGKTATEEEIQQYVASKVSNPKRLRGGVRFLNEIPKNPTGKIMRQALRGMANKSKSKL